MMSVLTVPRIDGPSQTRSELPRQPLETSSTTEPTIPSKKGLPTHGKKSVSFYEVVIVQPVRHLSDYTDFEKAECWYRASDRERIKEGIREQIKAYVRADLKGLLRFGNADGVCSRGLETIAGGAEGKERRKAGVLAVLRAQATQKLAQEQQQEYPADTDPSIELQNVYTPHARAAQYAAYAVGKLDEVEVTSQRFQKNSKPADSTKKTKPRQEPTIETEGIPSSVWVERRDERLLL